MFWAELLAIFCLMAFWKDNHCAGKIKDQFLYSVISAFVHTCIYLWILSHCFPFSHVLYITKVQIYKCYSINNPRQIPVLNGDPLGFQTFIHAFMYGIENKTGNDEDRLHWLHIHQWIIVDKGKSLNKCSFVALKYINLLTAAILKQKHDSVTDPFVNSKYHWQMTDRLWQKSLCELSVSHRKVFYNSGFIYLFS